MLNSCLRIDYFWPLPCASNSFGSFVKRCHFRQTRGCGTLELFVIGLFCHDAFFLRKDRYRYSLVVFLTPLGDPCKNWSFLVITGRCSWAVCAFSVFPWIVVHFGESKIYSFRVTNDFFLLFSRLLSIPSFTMRYDRMLCVSHSLHIFGHNEYFFRNNRSFNVKGAAEKRAIVKKQQ